MNRKLRKMSRECKAWTRDWPRNVGQKYRAATIPQAMKPKATLSPNRAWAGITNSFPKAGLKGPFGLSPSRRATGAGNVLTNA
jgi:hypothetical protein